MITQHTQKVQKLALLMEEQLAANDHKGGWDIDPPMDLIQRLLEETGELIRVVMTLQQTEANQADHSEGTVDVVKAAIGREAADVANFAMMIADVCGAFDVYVRPHLPRPAHMFRMKGDEN